MLPLVVIAALAVAPFVQECEHDHVPGIQGVDMVYAVGTVNGEDAIQVTLSYPSAMTSWAAVGLRAMSQQSMADLNVVAFDSNTDAVLEYEAVAGNVKPTVPSTGSTTEFVDRVTIQDRTTTTYYRLMASTASGLISFAKGDTINIALATGSGTVGTSGTWSQHMTTSREAIDLTFECPVVPVAPVPVALPVAVEPVSPPVAPVAVPEAIPAAAPSITPVSVTPVAVPEAATPTSPSVPEEPARVPTDSGGGSSPIGTVMAVLGGVAVLVAVLAAFYYYSRPRGGSAGMDWNEMRSMEREIESTVDQAHTIRGPEDANQGYKHMPF